MMQPAKDEGVLRVPAGVEVPPSLHVVGHQVAEAVLADGAGLPPRRLLLPLAVPVADQLLAFAVRAWLQLGFSFDGLGGSLEGDSPCQNAFSKSWNSPKRG